MFGRDPSQETPHDGEVSGTFVGKIVSISMRTGEVVRRLQAAEALFQWTS